jgi:hypothetical protein
MAKRRKTHPLLLILALMPMQFVLTPVNSIAASHTLALNPNIEPDRGGFRACYGITSRPYAHAIDVGNAPLYRLSDLKPDTSPSSPSSVQTSTRGRHGEWDTITATAAYGSPWESQREALWDFRDQSHTQSQLGRSLLRKSFRQGPFIAQNIKINPSPKTTAKMYPTPLVFLTQFLVSSTLTDKIVYLLFVLCYSLFIFNWLLKNHPNI